MVWLFRIAYGGSLCGLLTLCQAAWGQVATLSYPVVDLRYPSSDVPLPVFEMGAPVKETAREIHFRLSGDVFFDFDKATIRTEAEPVLGGLAKRIRAEFPGALVRVEGHTDAKGSDSYNQTLSQKRAESVKRWFSENGGLKSARITTQGFGESRPVAPNEKPDGSDNPEGRQENRRVEIVVEKGG